MSLLLNALIGGVCATLFAAGVVAATKRYGQRGLFEAAGLGLIGLEVLAYMDWRRDPETPLIASALLVGLPTAVATIVMALSVRRGHASTTRVLLGAGAWFVVAAMVFYAVGHSYRG